jgi:hypothetical protein
MFALRAFPISGRWFRRICEWRCTLGEAVRLRHSHGWPTDRAVSIELGLRSTSPENGNIQENRQRLSPISPVFLQNRSLETAARIAKARNWRALLRLLDVNARPTALPGWRRSADRARLRVNSLLTGNFTGKNAFFWLRNAVLKQ